MVLMSFNRLIPSVARVAIFAIILIGAKLLLQWVLKALLGHHLII